MSEPTTPPAPDELEISLFGPGFGECLVAHVGWGDWIIVDSCLAADGRTAAGLAYLKRLGVDPATAVRRVVATHWHQDHVRGLTQTLQECVGAKFVCSAAVFSKEFIALTDLWRQRQLPDSPVSEMTGVLDTIAKSDSALKGSRGECRFGFALANRCLWRRPQASETGLDTTAELHSLSPSDAAVRKSLDLIAGLFQTGETLTRPIASRPNHFSIVLWLRVGKVRCLLGADMEEQATPIGGWSLIVDSPERPSGEATLYKVPHHGSVTGDCSSVWTGMLQGSPMAILTPFHSGRVRLPTAQDAGRICSRTPNAFITAALRDRSSRGKSGTVNRTIHETVRSIRRVNDSFGQVRVRTKLNAAHGDWSVATFGDAGPLSELYPKQAA